MRRRTWLAAAAAVTACASGLAGACVGDDPDSATSSSGGVDGGGTDAPSGGDTSTGDSTAPPIDSGGDAAQPSDAGADSSCANTFPGVAFCDDFDNGGYQPSWKLTNFSSGVTVAIVSSPVSSPLYALSAYTTATVPDGGSAKTYLTVERNTAGKNEFKLEALLRQYAAVNPANVLVSPISMELRVGASAYLVFQIRPNAGTAVCVWPGEIVGRDGGSGEIPFTYGNWHHVTLSIVKNGAVATATCDVDGIQTTASHDVGSVNATASASIGLNASEQTGPTQYVFDDVVFDLK